MLFSTVLKSLRRAISYCNFMAEEDKIKIISSLLDRLFIFTSAVKEDIIAKASVDLNEEKFLALKAELEKAVEWQKQLVIEKMRQDPSLYDKIMEERKKITEEILKAYEDKVKKEDQDKINFMFLKIKSL